jgi:hypothetical protein
MKWADSCMELNTQNRELGEVPFEHLSVQASILVHGIDPKFVSKELFTALEPSSAPDILGLVPNRCASPVSPSNDPRARVELRWERDIWYNNQSG